MIDEKNAIHIYTDGSISKGPHIEHSYGGWSAVLVGKNSKKGIYGGEIDTTDNRLDMLGAITALELIKTPCSIVVYSCSEYLQKGASIWIEKWKKKEKIEKMKNPDLWKRIANVKEIHSVKWVWMKSGTGGQLEKEADALAYYGRMNARNGLFETQIVSY